MTPWYKSENILSKVNKYLAALIMLAYMLPVVIKGGDTEIRIHDVLDSYNVFEVLAESGKVFESGRNVKIENIMNGLPRDCFPSGYNIVIWLIMIFGATAGFFVNYCLVHIIGFIGLLLLLNEYLNKDDKFSFNWVLAASFAVLPVNVLAGISMTGIPLVFWAFYNLQNKKRLYLSFFVILVYVLYSSLIHTGVFVGLFLAIIFGYTLLKKQANLFFFIGLLCLGIGYILVEFNLLNSLLFSKEYVSHRKEFIPPHNLNLNGVIGLGIENMANGEYGSANYIGAPILLLALVLIGVLFFRKENYRDLVFLTGLIIFIGFLISFLDWQKMTGFYAKFPFFNTFSFKRVHFLLPVLIYVLFAFSIRRLTGIKEILIIPSIVFILTITAFNFKLDLDYNKNEKSMTFNQFFSADLFNKIDEFIGKPKNDYRIASVGMEPTPSQCYGFYTLDSYQNNYPLDYKLKFRSVIANELEKDEKTRKYFDDWGNRCYIPAKIEMQGNDLYIRNFSFNTSAFKGLGGKYLFSAAQIQASDSSGLQLKQKFSDRASLYTIYLYEAI